MNDNTGGGRGGAFMRLIAVICTLCLMAAALVGCTTGGSGASPASTAADDANVIRMGCDDYAPFSYMDVDGNLTGIDVELAREAFGRMGYTVEISIIDWEEKKNLLAAGKLDCIWSSFTMNGREDEYRWAGPYMKSRQVIAVNPESDIYELADLKNKIVAVQSTTKPEDIFREGDSRIPQLRKVISVAKRDLIFIMLSKGYVDALAAHDTAVNQFSQDTGLDFRILDEPLMSAGLGVAFYKNDKRTLPDELNDTLLEMRADGTMREILGKYLNDPDSYMED